MSNPHAIQGPAWDLSSEYQSPDCAEVENDLARISELLDAIEPHNSVLSEVSATDRVRAAQSVCRLSLDAFVLLQNIGTYAHCRLSVNSRDEAAQQLLGRLKNYQKRYSDLREPLTQFTTLAGDADIDAYLQDPIAADTEFQVRHARRRRHELLSLPEEQLAGGLSQDGIHAWGSLYGQLSGVLRCQVERGDGGEEMGLAQAAALMSGRDPATRQAAWRAINKAWEQHEETCAASLNAIAGWRLELARRRSTQQPVHFLDAPTHMNRIRRGTLDTLIEVAIAYRPLAQRATSLQARALGQPNLGPWDIRAPAPTISNGYGAATVPFDQAIDQIAAAYGQVHPDMSSFVCMMADNRWIEGTVGPNKRPGAYCTGFAKSRQPRVYCTYDGAPGEIITLAHELGHAYHSWVMRDLPLSQTNYGMSLAETASTFGETLVRDALIESAKEGQAKLDMMWQEVSALSTFLLDIPARFDFEKRFYEARAERPLRPGEFKTLMSEAWTGSYGETISEPDPMFWASKLHFSISGLSFYNFPYLFGYLFSNGIYAKRTGGEGWGEDFFDRFNLLLRDTGRMTAEDIAARHLNVDLAEPGFWQDTLEHIAPRVDAFESLLNKLNIGT